MNLNREFHPLFFPEPDGPEDYEPREFARIKVIRIQAYGPLHRSEASFTTAMRMYTPEEIPDLETFSTIFGGGKYELRAILENGQFYARRTLICPGESKPMHQTAPGASEGIAPLPVIESGAGNLDPMVALIVGMQERSAAAARESSQQQMTMITTLMGGMFQAMATIVAATSGNKENVGDLMRGFAEMTRANMPPAPAVDPVEQMKRAMELKTLIRQDDEAAQKPPQGEPEESASTLIKTIGEVAAPFIMRKIELAAQAPVAAAVDAATLPLPG